MNELWSLNHHEFNIWRAKNDIPRLFAFLRERLPYFRDWIAATGMDETILHKVVPTGALFRGDSPRLIVSRPTDPEGPDHILYCSDNSAEDEAAEWRMIGLEVEIHGVVPPYFHWLRRNRSPCGDRRLDINLWHQFNLPTAKAFLLKDFELLKLGGHELSDFVLINGRNLDFTNLDHLTIVGSNHGSEFIDISHASCNHITIKDGNLAFTRFHDCEMVNFACVSSRLQDVSFNDCRMATAKFTDSQLFNVGFHRSAVVPDFKRCEPWGLEYRPPKADRKFRAQADVYRLFRRAFQDAGLMEERSSYFYREQNCRRRFYFAPYHEAEEFHDAGTKGRLADAFGGFAKGQLDLKAACRMAAMVAGFHARVWTSRKYLAPALKYKAKWLTHTFDWLVWGYGEQPHRVFAFAVFVVTAYALAYLMFGVGNLGNFFGSWKEALYVSAVTFTTLGYGDIVPLTAAMRFTCVSEAFLGAFTMGLVVAGFSNRNRY